MRIRAGWTTTPEVIALLETDSEDGSQLNATPRDLAWSASQLERVERTLADAGATVDRTRLPETPLHELVGAVARALDGRTVDPRQTRTRT